MSIVSRLRHALARRRWLHRTCVAGLAVLAWWAATAWTGRLDAERASWGDHQAVLVVTADVPAGTPLGPVVTSREHPAAVVPARAVAPGELGPDAVARRELVAGAMLIDADLAPSAAPHVLVGDGQVAVAVTERIPAGVGIGDRVVVAADGMVLADQATVVGATDERVLVALDEALAPMVAAAATGPSGVSLLLRP